MMNFRIWSNEFESNSKCMETKCADCYIFIRLYVIMIETEYN